MRQNKEGHSGGDNQRKEMGEQIGSLSLFFFLSFMPLEKLQLLSSYFLNHFSVLWSLTLRQSPSHHIGLESL